MDITDAEQQDTMSQNAISSTAGFVNNPPTSGLTIGERRIGADLAYRIRLPEPEIPETIVTMPSTADDSTSHPSALRPRLSSGNGVVKRPPTQTDNYDELLLRLSNEFDPVVEPEWDTVVYIGPPPQEHRQDDHEYEYIKQHFSKPYLMKSETLREAGSAQLNKFLGPMSARSERKLKKLGVHQLLPKDKKAKYYVDLRPMQDEDEALLMITELTCTSGILSWHMSHLASGVPKTMICGKDDLNFTSKPHVRPWIEIDDSNGDGSDDTRMEGVQNTAAGGEAEILDLEPEYSTIRHYTAIERLLHALAGRDPKLNSAPKVWTFFSIAKFFDCATQARVTRWIYDWLFANNNSNFIQANPEVAYRIAMGIRSPDVLRATFAMLVGERALIQAGRNNPNSADMHLASSHRSMHGRAFATLDDDELNRIDHAAHSLTRRMISLFNDLTQGPLATSTPRMVSELTKFEFLRKWYDDKRIVDEPYNLVREYLRGEIFAALSQNLQEGDLMRLYRTKGLREFGWLKRSKSFADAYNAMPLPQRLLTQSFWSQLENYGLYQESEKLTSWCDGHNLTGLSSLAPDFEGGFTCVYKNDLHDAIQAMNDHIAADYKWVHKHKSEWSNMMHNKYQDDSDDELDGLLPDAGGSAQRPAAQQEVVRAMRGFGMTNDIDMPGFGDAQDHPYDAVAQHHQQQGGPLIIKTAVLLAQLSMKMRSRIMREVLTPGYVNEELGIESEISISQMDILLCLNDEEWKYLPLWAEGLDDGTGGVFAEIDVPDMEAIEGFRGGAIGLHGVPGREGSVGGSFSMAGDSDDFDDIKTDEAVSTVGKASRIATDGTTSAGASTVMSLDE